MNFWQLFRLFRQFPVNELLNFPEDFTDSKAVRTWMRAVVKSIGVVTELTNTKLDDKALRGIRYALHDDEIWDTVHGLLAELLVRKPSVYVSDETYTGELSAIVGISPTLIMLIIQAIRILLDFLRNRK